MFRCRLSALEIPREYARACSQIDSAHASRTDHLNAALRATCPGLSLRLGTAALFMRGKCKAGLAVGNEFIFAVDFSRLFPRGCAWPRETGHIPHVSLNELFAARPYLPRHSRTSGEQRVPRITGQADLGAGRCGDHGGYGHAGTCGHCADGCYQQPCFSAINGLHDHGARQVLVTQSTAGRRWASHRPDQDHGLASASISVTISCHAEDCGSINSKCPAPAMVISRGDSCAARAFCAKRESNSFGTISSRSPDIST